MFAFSSQFGDALDVRRSMFDVRVFSSVRRSMFDVRVLLD